jgi:hypothetical protein
MPNAFETIFIDTAQRRGVARRAREVVAGLSSIDRIQLFAKLHNLHLLEIGNQVILAAPGEIHIHF